MPRKSIEKPKLPPPVDDSSESTVSSLDDDVENVLPEPKAEEKIISTPAPVSEVPKHVGGTPKKPRVRKTANDEELKALKKANFAKAVEASAIARAQKVEEARLKAEQESKEKEELLRQAKEQAMKEVYERILLEQKQALKTELNKKMKTAPKKAAKATKQKEVMEELLQSKRHPYGEEIMNEPEEVAPAPKAIEKPKPAPKKVSVAPPAFVSPIDRLRMSGF